MKKSEIVSLTQLRFVAASLVFIAHFRVFDETLSIIETSWLRNLGNYGVTLFFILSGFVLAYSYSDASFSTVKEKLAFVFNRICKIWPSHVLTFFFAIPLTYLGGQSAMLKSGFFWIVNLFLLQGWFVELNGFNAPAWTLSCELFFYIMFPFALPLAKKIGFKSTLSLALLGMLLIYVVSPQASIVENEFSISLLSHKRFAPARFFEFLAGMGLHSFYITRSETRRGGGTGALWGGACLILGALISFLTLYISRSSHTALYGFGAFLVVAGTAFLPPVSLETRLGRLFHLLGNASFAFYLLPGVVLCAIRGLFQTAFFTPIR
ncbi:MAG: acyltransferase, partial [Kiritimatiellaeota bacterium]|nr:acyltransferase [Kiritimatiellota bacterium]